MKFLFFLFLSSLFFISCQENFSSDGAILATAVSQAKVSYLANSRDVTLNAKIKFNFETGYACFKVHSSDQGIIESFTVTSTENTPTADGKGINLMIADTNNLYLFTKMRINFKANSPLGGNKLGGIVTCLVPMMMGNKVENSTELVLSKDLPNYIIDNTNRYLNKCVVDTSRKSAMTETSIMGIDGDFTVVGYGPSSVDESIFDCI
ncbi:hypothetical protein N9N67_02970 [Bacteriovoracaceae bacterium]|nr:hypothetical protein [Bacteriovoracaceae bacterium]